MLDARSAAITERMAPLPPIIDDGAYPVIAAVLMLPDTLTAFVALLAPLAGGGWRLIPQSAEGRDALARAFPRRLGATVPQEEQAGLGE